jgi:hypothetical protein
MVMTNWLSKNLKVQKQQLILFRNILLLRFSMINKVATTHCSFLRLQIKREDISTNAVSVIKTEVYRILRDVCIVSRDVCIVLNRLTCIDSKLSEMEILAQPLSLPFIIGNLIYCNNLMTSIVWS